MSPLNLSPSIFKEVKAQVTFTDQKGKSNEIFASQITIRNQVNAYPTVDIQMAPIQISAEASDGGGDGKFKIDDIIKTGVGGLFGITKEKSSFVTVDTFLKEAEFFQKELLNAPGDELPEPEISIKISLGDEGGFGWRDVVSDPVGSVIGAAASLGTSSTAGSGRDAAGGGDGEMKFMAVQPVINITKNSANVSLSGLHPISRLQNISYKAYKLLTERVKVGEALGSPANGHALQDAEAKGLITKQDGLSTDPNATTFNKLAASIFDTLKALEPTLKDIHSTTTVAAEGMLAQIENNKLYVSVLDDFLKENTTGGSDNSKLFGNDYVTDESKRAIVRRLAHYFTSSENLLDTIMRQVTPAYLMQFRCSLFNVNAILERSAVYADGLDVGAEGGSEGGSADVKPIEVDIDSVVMSLAPKYQLPINQVILFDEAPGDAITNLADGYRTPFSLPVMIKNTIVGYPDGNETKLIRGKPLFVRVPAYMDFTSKGVETLKAKRNLEKFTVETSVNTLEGIKTEQEETVKQATEVQTKGANFLLKWAEALYKNVSMRYITSVVVMPLTLTLEVGQIYDVKTASPNSAILFQGFLGEVEHHISVNNDAGRTYTRATFSYVRTKGFKDQESSVKIKLKSFARNPVGFLRNAAADLLFAPPAPPAPPAP